MRINCWWLWKALKGKNIPFPIRGKCGHHTEHGFVGQDAQTRMVVSDCVEMEFVYVVVFFDALVFHDYTKSENKTLKQVLAGSEAPLLNILQHTRI